MTLSALDDPKPVGTVSNHPKSKSRQEQHARHLLASGAYESDGSESASQRAQEKAEASKLPRDETSSSSGAPEDPKGTAGARAELDRHNEGGSVSLAGW